MSVTFRILSNPGLVHIRYDGFADLASTMAAAQSCTTHPDFRPGLPHYFDLSGATGFEKNFVSFFEMQAKIAEMYLPAKGDLIFVFHAPDGPPREMASLVRKTWEGVPRIVVRIVASHRDALDILGITDADLSVAS